MNFKFNVKYFIGKNWPIYVGGVLIGIGAILFVLFAVDVLFMPFYALVALIAGVVMVVFTAGGKTNEGDIGQQVEKLKSGVTDTAMGKFKLDERKSRTLPPFVFGDFDFPAEYAKKGNDGKYRSSMYASGVILFGADKLYVYAKDTSIVDDTGSETAREIPYENYSGMEIQPAEYKYTEGKKAMTVNYDRVVIKDTTGESMSFPIHNDADFDTMRLNLARYMKQRAEKKAQ